MSSGFPDSRSGVRVQVVFVTVGEFKRRRLGLCWMLTGEPHFSAGQAVPGTGAKSSFKHSSPGLI